MVIVYKSGKMNSKKITKIFAVKNENELDNLIRISQEIKYVNVKPYSHNIIGLTLRILKEDHNYDDEKIKLVVTTFGLHKKGWGYLL
jgi:hypothetical protein